MPASVGIMGTRAPKFPRRSGRPVVSDLAQAEATVVDLASTRDVCSVSTTGDARLCSLSRAMTMVVTDHSGWLGQIRPRCDVGKFALEVLGARATQRAGRFGRPVDSDLAQAEATVVDSTSTRRVHSFSVIFERAATHVLTK